MTSPVKASARALVGFALGCLLASRAAAEPTQAAARAAAATHFERAVRLVNDGDLSGALAEFERARGLAPGSPVLAYNIGLVDAALNRPLAAARELEQALTQPEALKAPELERARSLLSAQLDKIGQVTLTTNVRSGIVELDNVEWATLPLSGPLQVPHGVHVIGVVSPGFAPARREILVGGRERTAISLELNAIEGLLAHVRIQCRISAADVFVDGRRAGTTPLAASLALIPGKHQFELKRAGYVAVQRELDLPEGTQATLSLELPVDPNSLGREGGQLEVRPSETQAELSVDGSELRLLKGPLMLPRGPHRLRIERGGFVPTERDVEVHAGATRAISVRLQPTPETRIAQVSAAERARLWSYVTIGSGALIAAGGLTLAVVEQRRLADARRDFSDLQTDYVPRSGGSCDATVELSPTQEATCRTSWSTASARIHSANLGRTVGWLGTGVGGALFVTGVVMRLLADDPHRYDEPATPSLFGALSVRSWLAPRALLISADATF